VRLVVLGPLQVVDGLGTVRPVPAAKQRIVQPVAGSSVSHPAGPLNCGPEGFDLAEADWLWRTACGEADAGQWQPVSSLLDRRRQQPRAGVA
jgi:hypothetical protein